MRRFYIANLSKNVVFSDNNPGMDVTEDLLLGKEMFKMLYPDAMVDNLFFDSLLRVDDTIAPNVDFKWLFSDRPLRWDPTYHRWLIWVDEKHMWFSSYTGD